jgi:putative hemolysin
MSASRSSGSRPRHEDLAVFQALAPDQVRDAQRLRYHVFAEEQGARLPTGESGLDTDCFDAHCRHLLVCHARSHEVVACARVLAEDRALTIGGFACVAKFDLTRVLSMPGRFLELSRVCVHRDYRDGPALPVFLGGVTGLMAADSFDFLMGCAGISMLDGGATAVSTFLSLREDYLSPEYQRVFALLPLPIPKNARAIGQTAVPPLLEALLGLGAQICGDPCWDPTFNHADLFWLLHRERLSLQAGREYPAQAMEIVAEEPRCSCAVSSRRKNMYNS